MALQNFVLHYRNYVLFCFCFIVVMNSFTVMKLGPKQRVTMLLLLIALNLIALLSLLEYFWLKKLFGSIVLAPAAMAMTSSAMIRAVFNEANAKKKPGGIEVPPQERTTG